METIYLGMSGMTLDHLVQIARKKTEVRLTRSAIDRISANRECIENWVRQEERIYGITTGFGALSEVAISRGNTRRLQENILKSHSAGAGELFDEASVRAMMALRLKDAARGHSAMTLNSVNMLITMLNKGVYPAVPQKGSVGASGDLVPLAHIALVLLGEGDAFFEDRQISGMEALSICGLKPVKLNPGEGLALVNGTQVMTAVGAMAVHDARKLNKIADISAAMSLEVLMGSRTEFNPLIHKIRPHTGQRIAAENMLKITHNSEIISSHQDCKRIQDAYTLRCSPQVHGAIKDTVNYTAGVVETEMNSSTNNPLIFSEENKYLSGGNFHGEPVALVMDFLAIGMAELANISERRIERLVNPNLSGLPAFLVKDGGLNSGFMIAQYTAAALVSENKVLCHPASVDSIPTSANKEDHVSMGTIAARKAREVIRNVESVIAIELLCSAQALDLFTNHRPGNGVLVAYRAIREYVSHMETDRFLSRDIAAVVNLIQSGKIVEAVEKRIGPLN